MREQLHTVRHAFHLGLAAGARRHDRPGVNALVARLHADPLNRTPRAASRSPDSPPGEYRIAVVLDMDPNELEKKTFFEQMMAQSLALTLVQGKDVRQDFRIAQLGH